ncbi:Fe-S cluster assembly ATPase SufC [Candidatus Dojkabacteria bacterium]|nr:Fe-S cluster assembly ATPase SufC [Candidatus Dojkabacteria bacterium]
MLEIKNLEVRTGDKLIINNFNLDINPGETHVLMGPNGSGKSTLCKAIMGHPKYTITKGSISVNKKNIKNLESHERAKLGLFVAMQHPTEIPGVNFSNFLRLAYNSRFGKDKKIPVFKFRKILKDKLKILDFSEKFLERNLNEGFSGGEKKKAEILQLAVLEPKYAILDETDSGLDIDALKTVFNGLKEIQNKNKQMAFLIITHYEKIFEFISPDFIHVFKDGSIVETGGMEIIEKIHKQGYL